MKSSEEKPKSFLFEEILSIQSFLDLLDSFFKIYLWNNKIKAKVFHIII